MTKPAEYLFYRVTRTEETYPSSGAIYLGLPGLDGRRYPRLKEVHPFFTRALRFKVGQTRTLPLTADMARGLELQKWAVRLRRGQGRPLTNGQRALVRICEDRHQRLESARDEVLSFTSPYGDYVRAGLVGRYFQTARIGEELEGLRASGIVPDEVADTMAAVVERLLELRSDLEAKGWTFGRNGTPCPPSSGGRPAKYPADAIRAHYRQLALQHLASGSDQEVVERIQDDLRPIFGDLTYAEVREAVKYERRREDEPTPPVPEPPA